MNDYKTIDKQQWTCLNKEGDAGKDADFLVFDNDLLKAEHEGFSHNIPQEVYFGGNKIN